MVYGFHWLLTIFLGSWCFAILIKESLNTWNCDLLSFWQACIRNSYDTGGHQTYCPVFPIFFFQEGYVFWPGFLGGKIWVSEAGLYDWCRHGKPQWSSMGWSVHQSIMMSTAKDNGIKESQTIRRMHRHKERGGRSQFPFFWSLTSFFPDDESWFLKHICQCGF